jgi:hypothetical protein
MSLRSLLTEAGYRLRGNRAECRNCKGSATWTVSFTDEVAYCHRCHWTANEFMLARGFGKTLQPESPEKFAAREKASQFGKWIDEQYVQTARQYRCLGRSASLAKHMLSRFPDCEPAWDALARFYSDEPTLSGALDVFSFAKVSDWLESPTTPVSLFQMWEGVANAA